MEIEKTKLILNDILSKSKSSKDILPTLSDDQLSELQDAFKVLSKNMGPLSYGSAGGSMVGSGVVKEEADSEIGEQSSSDEDVDKSEPRETLKMSENGQWNISLKKREHKTRSANPDPSTGVDLAAAAARLSARRDPAPSARTRTKSKCNPLIQKGSYMSELLKTSTNGQWELLEKKASNEAYHFEHTGVHPYAGGSGNKYAPHWHSFTVKQGRKHVGIATAHDESDNLDVGHVHALEPGHDHDKISAALQKHLNTHYKKIRALKDQ